eukprot:TRINITY_DN14193_c0_g1_i2.p2 TRINITY_DN14193_c0_g1~~TRINITY_DN14193_c0_g1_i2.p2  ORF type:complete len:103 (+),score=21.62 TRINITY_DN14193_c0_g1_i2:72-380(+)
MIRRPPRSTLSSSSAASDVYKRQHLGHPLLVQPLPAAPRPFLSNLFAPTVLQMLNKIRMLNMAEDVPDTFVEGFPWVFHQTLWEPQIRKRVRVRVRTQALGG